MAKLKCSEGCGRDAEFWCVDTAKAFSPQCMGRVHLHVLPKTLTYTFEKIDYEHKGTHEITSYILNTLVTVIIAFAFLSRGWADNYFTGEPVCPSMRMGRQVLARYDMNVFYYYKASIATYCDIEDSFWRLLMDGWFRGLVTGSDSWLLLLVTLPKAFIFKTAIVTVLQPVMGFIYGLVGIVIDRLVFFGITEANAIKAMWDKHVGGAKKAITEHDVSVKTAPVQAAFWRIVNFMTVGTYHWVQLKRRTYLALLSKMFDALYYAGLVRVVWRYFLEAYAPAVANAVGLCSIKELALEVAVYYSLSFLCKYIDASLDKVFPKPGAPGAGGPPLTKTSESYVLDGKRSPVAYYNYWKARMTRLYTSYKGDAGAIGGTVETVFSLVIGLRIFGIVVSPYFNISKVLRGLMSMVGFSDMLTRHADWFSLVTGYTEQGVYVSEILADFGLLQLFTGAVGTLNIGKEVAVGETYEISEMLLHLYEAFWRALLPFAFYHAQKYWTAYQAAKEGAFATQWKKPEVEPGSFLGWMKANGCPTWVAEEAPATES